MRTVPRLLSLLTATAMLLLTGSYAASAAPLDNASVGAERDTALIAADYEEVGSTLSPDTALPSAYSGRDLGYTTAVRSQVYNTCWAYSSTAILETAMNRSGDTTEFLSPMHMNFWATTRSDGTGWNRTYSEAGYPYIALGYLTSWIGARLDSEFPTSTAFSRYSELDASSTPYAGVTSLMYIDGSDIDTVKTAIYDYGAVVGNFHYDATRLNDTTSAYYYETPGLSTASLFGHSVALVGWDDSFPRESFVEDYRPDSDGAWLCKNSWGSTWCSDGGYFWISYEDEYLFDSRFGPSYAFTGYQLLSQSNRMKQCETYGSTYDFSYVNSAVRTRMTYANVLDFSDEYDVIDKVIFESTAEGSDYEIYYIPVDTAGIPDDNQSHWRLLYSGTIAYQGYTCADIDNIVVTDDRCAIGVTILKTDASDSLNIGVDEWISVSRLGKYIFLPDTDYGKSYLLGYDVEPVDAMDFYRDELSDDIGGTFVIKAATTTLGPLGDADLDGEVTIFDVTRIQRYLAHMTTFNEQQLLLADFDGDGIVTIVDATYIQRFLAGYLD